MTSSKAPKSLALAAAATGTLAMEPFACSRALAQTSLGSGLIPATPDQLTNAVLGGIALACAALAIISARRARRVARDTAREKERLEEAALSGEHLGAMAAIEPQCFILWSEEAPQLLVHTLPASVGVPAKLPQIMRLGSWLHPEDEAQIAKYLERLKNRGERFIANASTLDGQILEIAGGIWGADMILRMRQVSPVNNELVRLIADNKRLKRALSEREGLLEALPIPVWIRDHKGALIWVNNAYTATVNARSREDALRGQVELFEARQRTALARLLQMRKPSRLKLQTIVNGTVQIYEAVVAHLGRGSGGAALDVAPLATAKSELERQMEAHGRTLNKVSTGIAVFGADKKLVYSNDALARIWGFDREFLAQAPSAAALFDLLRQGRLLPDRLDYRRWRDHHLLAWDGQGTLDELWHLPNGRTVKVLTDRRDDGGMAFLFDDVTERLSLQRQYHNLTEVQRETLDHLSEGIAVFGTDGRLRLFNPAFASSWQLPESLLEGTPHVEEIIRHCETLAPGHELWPVARQAISGISDARSTFGGVVARTDEKYLAFVGTPLPDGGTLLSFADITDSRRIEAVLMERSEALEAADRLKSSFLSHVSYELRTPLTSIIGFTELLSARHAGDLTEKQREYLKDIKASSQVLLTIINDILDLAVIDAGALDLKLSPIKLAEIVEGAELAVRERLSRSSITLDIHIGEGAETVIADANRLTQVLYNLLSNAIGFSGEGDTITLTCRREGGGIAISVQDTGLGIPEEEQATVFERFQTKSQGSRHRGAGLGLSLVKSLVELHKGRVSLRSTPGAGTTVTVFLPDNHAALEQKPAEERSKDPVASSY